MFEMNGIKYDFKLISVEDALEVQDIIAELSKEESSRERSIELDRKLRKIANKYLRIYLKEGNVEKSLTDQDEDYYAMQFGNPLYSNEIILSFGEVIRGFLESLPNFKKRLEEGKKKANQGTSK